MSAQRFRKKPVEIEAMHWDGSRSSIEAACKWVNASDDLLDDPTLTFCFTGSGDATDVTLATLEGFLSVSPGDWIIRGVAGEFYPCKPGIFAATYENVSTASKRIRYRALPSERSMWVRFWLTLAFVLGVEMLLAFGLDAWWGESARGASAAVTLAVCIVMLCVGGYALDACQRRDQWQVEE